MSYREEKKRKKSLLTKNYLWESPLLWIFLIFFLWLLLNLNVLSIKKLAISSLTLRDPYLSYTIFSAGISHRSFFHLLFNLIFLIGLYWFSLKEKFYSYPRSFTQLALVINLIQGFLLAVFLLYEGSFQKYIYGSSGIICGITSFLVIESLKNKKKNFPLLRISLILIFMISIIDIFYFPTSSLGSVSHLIGILSGLLLSFTPFQKEVLFN